MVSVQLHVVLGLWLEQEQLPGACSDVHGCDVVPGTTIRHAGVEPLLSVFCSKSAHMGRSKLYGRPMFPNGYYISTVKPEMTLGVIWIDFFLKLYIYRYLRFIVKDSSFYF